MANKLLLTNLEQFPRNKSRIICPQLANLQSLAKIRGLNKSAKIRGLINTAEISFKNELQQAIVSKFFTANSKKALRYHFVVDIDCGIK